DPDGAEATRGFLPFPKALEHRHPWGRRQHTSGITQMKNRLLAATVAALLASGTARADWPLVHYATGNNALVAGNATITDLAPAPEWNTGPQDLQTSCRAVIAGGLLYAVATQSSPDRVW